MTDVHCTTEWVIFSLPLESILFVSDTVGCTNVIALDAVGNAVLEHGIGCSPDIEILADDITILIGFDAESLLQVVEVVGEFGRLAGL